MRFYKDDNAIINSKYIPKASDLENYVKVVKKVTTIKDVENEVKYLLNEWYKTHK